MQANVFFLHPAAATFIQVHHHQHPAPPFSAQAYNSALGTKRAACWGRPRHRDATSQGQFLCLIMCISESDLFI